VALNTINQINHERLFELISIVLQLDTIIIGSLQSFSIFNIFQYVFLICLNRYTSRKNIDGSLVVYATLLSWPEEPVLKLGTPIPSQVTVVSMLGFPDVFIWNFGPENKGI
jgi:hypothetical protein